MPKRERRFSPDSRYRKWNREEPEGEERGAQPAGRRAVRARGRERAASEPSIARFRARIQIRHSIHIVLREAKTRLRADGVVHQRRRIARVPQAEDVADL